MSLESAIADLAAAIREQTAASSKVIVTDPVAPGLIPGSGPTVSAPAPVTKEPALKPRKPKAVEAAPAVAATPPKLKDVADAIMGVANQISRAEGIALIKKYGGTKISEIPLDKQGAALTEARELLAAHAAKLAATPAADDGEGSLI